MNGSCHALTPDHVDPTRPAARRGISLLEIMISIGVVGIGLIGVASLIPLAHYKASQGVREERKTLFGQRAYREFFVQEYDRPGSFLSSGQGTPYWIWLSGQSPYGIYDGSTGHIIPQTYCFDPHWVAGRRSLPQVLPTGTFPDVGPAEILIPRITVLAYRPEQLRESLLLHGGQPAIASNRMMGFVANPQPVSLVRTEEIFRMRDDVVVEKPNNPNDIARLTYLSETTNPGNPTVPQLPMKRLSSGTYSWMATLVPELTSTHSPVDPTVIVPYVNNRYTLSIVVLNQRNVLSPYREEVVAQVAPPPASVMSGMAKDIFISEFGPSPPVPENVGVRHIRQGDWIALLQKVPFPPPQSTFTHLYWYQVVSTDEQDSDQTMSRQLSLAGPDWNPDPSQPVYAIYLRNVETIYEKTVELQQ